MQLFSTMRQNSFLFFRYSMSKKSKTDIITLILVTTVGIFTWLIFKNKKTVLLITTYLPWVLLATYLLSVVRCRNISRGIVLKSTEKDCCWCLFLMYGCISIYNCMWKSCFMSLTSSDCRQRSDSWTPWHCGPMLAVSQPFHCYFDP